MKMPVPSMPEYQQRSTWVSDFLSGMLCVRELWGVCVGGVWGVGIYLLYPLGIYTRSDSPTPRVFSHFSSVRERQGTGQALTCENVFFVI